MATISTDAELRQLSRDKLTFPPAYEAVRPFFDPNTRWGRGGGQGHLAYRTLKDHFPELSTREVFVIVLTAKHLFGSGHESD